MLVWIDLETSGLDPTSCVVLEVACIVTDDKYTELARGSWVTNEARKVDFGQVSPYVLDMHATNGLWGESLAHGVPLNYNPDGHTVTDDLHQLIYDACAGSAWCKAGGKPEEFKPLLAGSSVHFDRGYIDKHMPRVAKLLHYRHLDVTSVAEWVRRINPRLYDEADRVYPQSPNHRAMADIERSINLARFYCANVITTEAT